MLCGDGVISSWKIGLQHLNLIRFLICLLFYKISKYSWSSYSQMSFEIGVPKIFAVFPGKHLCWSLFLVKLQAWNPPTQGFFYEQFEISKNTFFHRTPPVTSYAILTWAFENYVTSHDDDTSAL